MFLLARSHQIHQLDRGIEEKAALIVSMIEVTGDTVELDFEELDLNSFEAYLGGRGSRGTRGGWYLKVWIDSHLAYRSPSFGRCELGLPSYRQATQKVSWVELPSSVPARGVLLDFVPVNRSLETLTGRTVGQLPPSASDNSPIPISVFLAHDASEVLETVHHVAVGLVAITTAAVLVVALILAASVNRGLRPVEALTTHIEKVNATDLDNNLSVPSLPTELDPIVVQFNALLSRLQAAFERERGFCADIAHELRTPLAGLRTTLEVAGARPRSGAEYTHAIERCCQMVVQTQNLIEYLLQISKLETGQIKLQPKWINLEEELQSIWQDLHDKTTRLNYQLSWDIDAAARVWADPVVLEIVFRNLFNNAIEHVDDHGHIEIVSVPESEGIKISVSNSGSRIHAVDTEKVFDRFWRGSESRINTGLHFGLGLSLAQRAMHSLGGKLSVDSELNGMFRVTCSLNNHQRSPTP